MSEDAGSEKVFPASPRKRREARKNGQVARSSDLSGTLVMLALVVAIRIAITHGVAFDSLRADLYNAFSFDPKLQVFDGQAVSNIQIEMARAIGVLIVPPMLAAVALGVITNVAQVGLFVSLQALKPDFNRINPATGFKRVFSTRGTVELLKGSLKIGLISWICWRAISDSMPAIIGALQLPFIPFLCQIGDLLWSLGLHVCSVLFIMAVADYAFQKYEFEKTMRMTREEMKQEIKQSDGDPFIKQRIRQKQRAMAQKRMMQQVPKADVVITNPTHFAVALKYDGKSMNAPTVIARGQDLVAQTIKDLAKDSGVPTVENRPVARALYYDVPLGREVPPQLYQAVAEVLAFVYRTKRETAKSAGQQYRAVGEH